MNQMLKTAGDMVGQMNAAQTSLDRASGAFSENATDYVTLQMNSLVSFSNETLADVFDLGAELVLLREAFLRDQVMANITEADVVELKERLSKQGFTTDEIQRLKQAGFTDEEIRDLLSGLLAAPDTALAGSYPDKFQDFADGLWAVNSVPEPATIAAIAIGLLGVWAVRMRRAR